MHNSNAYDEVALVMELGVNGLGTIRSLAVDKRIKIIGIGSAHSIGQYSRYLTESYLVKTNDMEDVFSGLSMINDRYEKIVPFPTGDDFWVNVLWRFKGELSNFVIDYNELVPLLMSKDYQFELASKLGIPFAETKALNGPDDLKLLRELTFPVVVKPITRNTKRELFRIRKYDSFERLSKNIFGYLGDHKFLVTQFIDGPDSNLHTFGSYSKSGKVVMEFTGRKLTQNPSSLGVVGIAEDTPPPRKIVEYSRKLIGEVGFSGISQIEFKKDRTTDDYYLIEVNPRSWMWVYLSTVCGKNLPLAKYYTLTSRDELIRAEENKKRHLFIDEHSILYNSLREKKAKWLFHILRRLCSHKFVLALYNSSDKRPFLKDFQRLFLRYKER